MKQKRFMSLLLTLCMLFTLVPFSAFADDLTPAENATIYLTVNNRGVIATDNEGKIMANREVTVRDINSDGKLTCDEALIAAHKAYNTEDGYIGGAYVTKLWGIETANTLFFVNNVGLTNGVGTDTVSNGDKLTASINKDNVTYADWYTFFDTTEKTAAPNEEFTLTLKGHLGMAFNEADKVDVTLADISIGTWNNGVFTQIDDKKTDENGNTTLSFSETGTYYITADGSLESETTDYNLMNMSTAENPVYGVMDYTTYATQMAYTEADYAIMGNSSAKFSVQLPKGIQDTTLETICNFLEDNIDAEYTGEEIADKVNLSRVTVKRYMSYLLEKGKIVGRMNYETGGRPCMLYKWNIK